MTNASGAQAVPALLELFPSLEARLATDDRRELAEAMIPVLARLQERIPDDQREGVAEEPEQVAYADEASRDPWLFRNLVQGTPLADAVTLVFDVTPEVAPVENPPAFARERLLELAATAGNDPVRQAIATNRALWIGALEPSP